MNNYSDPLDTEAKNYFASEFFSAHPELYLLREYVLNFLEAEERILSSQRDDVGSAFMVVVHTYFNVELILDMGLFFDGGAVVAEAAYRFAVMFGIPQHSETTLEFLGEVRTMANSAFDDGQRKEWEALNQQIQRNRKHQ